MDLLLAYFQGAFKLKCRQMIPSLCNLCYRHSYSAAHRLTPTLKNFAGGLVRFKWESMLFTHVTVNKYARFQTERLFLPNIKLQSFIFTLAVVCYYQYRFPEGKLKERSCITAFVTYPLAYGMRMRWAQRITSDRT